MNNNYSYVPINAIFSKLIRDVTDEFSEADVIEWCGEALEAIGAQRAYEEAVAFIEVKNFQAQLPKGIHNIIQVARNTKWDTTMSADKDKYCPAYVANQLTQTEEESEDCEDCGEGCTSDTVPDFIILGCDGMPLNDYDVAYYRPYFNLKYEYFDWCNSSYYQLNYSPVRLATSTLYQTLVCQNKDSNENCKYGRDEYTVIQNKVLRFNFKEGYVAVAYNKQITDAATGYPMIPDTYSYKQAITYYTKWRMLERQCYNNRQGACGLADKAEQQWQWYCGQAGSANLMPQGIDEYQNLLDQRSYILPDYNKYYSFFGNLAVPEDRGYLDPNHRNHRGNYYL